MNYDIIQIKKKVVKGVGHKYLILNVQNCGLCVKNVNKRHLK